MEDEVQVEQVSEETVSEEVKPEETKETPQPLTEERVQQILEQDREVTRRQFQSEKDKAIAEVRREAEKRVRFAEGESASYRTSFSGLDEETRKEAELARLQGKEKHLGSFFQEEEQRKQNDAYFQQLQNSLVDYIKELGIDPNDKGIDWAQEEPDFLKGRSRFDASITKIVKGKQVETEQKADTKVKEMESKLRKDLGLDSVDTTTSGADTSEDTFKAKMLDPDYVTTPEDIKRIEEIQKKNKGG